MNIDIESILPNKEFPDYSVFSNNIHTLYFQYALPYLTEYVSNENMLFVCQTHFEELISCNYVLQAEYVEWYDPRNEFYITNKFHKNRYMDFYILAREKEVLMFFIREAL